MMAISFRSTPISRRNGARGSKNSRLFFTVGSPVRSGDQSGAVLGAGREIVAPIYFEPTDPKVREAMKFYSKLASTVRQAGARLLVVYVPLSYAIHREDESRWRLLGIRDIPSQMALDTAFI